MSQPNNPGAVVVDANILISLCIKEPVTFTQAHTAFNDYGKNGWDFYAPSVIVAEVLYVLCQKLQTGLITQAKYDEAIEFFKDYMSLISTPAGGDAPLIQRAKEIQSGYGCSRSADCLYIALTEELAGSGMAELLTLDSGCVNQAAKNAPSVKVNLR
ncbi:MAG: type II toxin-antitoxin system VapC family toxin [Blastocatellales bacterium]